MPIGVWGGHVHTITFKMNTQQGPTVRHRNSAQCHMAAWMGGEFGGEWILCICMVESLCSSPQTITILLIRYTLI